MFSDRSFSSLTLEDFRSLVERHESESLHVDFKESAYSGRPQDIREMLRDITSLANSEGGYLILGIREDDRSRAFELTPISKPHEIAKSMYHACLDCIQDRIVDLEIGVYETGDNQGLIVVHVPTSDNRPHMMIRDHSTDLFKRFGTDKRPMTISEIREQILNNTRYRRVIELELQSKGYTRTGKTKSSPNGAPYINVYTKSVVGQFIKRYLISSVRAKSLIIISPYIGDLLGESYNLNDILIKASADKTRVYVVWGAGIIGGK